MSSTIIALLAFGAIAAIFVAWRYFTVVGAQQRLKQEALDKLRPIWTRIYSGDEPDLADIERFAKDPKTRLELFDFLLYHNRLGIFPSLYRTKPSLAESQLVVWLMHPSELGAAPDQIEFAEEVELSNRLGRPEDWLVFRFGVNPPHWGAKDGVMAGVVGPFEKRSGDEIMPAEVTWSMFKPFESMSAKDHAVAVRKLAVKAGLMRD